jgi:hypothetical protein
MLGLQGEEAILAAKTALRGKMPTVEFGGLKDLTPEVWQQMTGHIAGHPGLMQLQKIRAYDALAKMVHGQVPQKNEVKLLNEIFGRSTVDSLATERSKLRTLANNGIRLYHLPRTMMSTFDLSAPFRQALVSSVRHPRIFVRNFKRMHRMWASEEVYQQQMNEIVAHPFYPIFKEMKVEFTDLGEDFTKREEAFLSDIAEKIVPGVRMSSRAYTGFLNRQRFDLAVASIEKMQRFLISQGESLDTYAKTPEMLDSFGRVINAATGRGSFGKSEFAKDLLKTSNYFLFSPRLLASRINFLNPVWYMSLHPVARKEAIESFVSMLGVVTMIGGLAKLGGATVELDPRNSDFAKIKIGSTRIDMLGGFQQVVRYGAQIISGMQISPTTGEASVLTGGGFGDPTRGSVFMRFVRSKLAPLPSLAWDAAVEKDFMGEPFDIKRAAYERMLPILWGDLIDMARDGWPAKTYLPYPLSLYGVGMQTFKPDEPKPAGGSDIGTDLDLDLDLDLDISP